MDRMGYRATDMLAPKDNMADGAQDAFPPSNRKKLRSGHSLFHIEGKSSHIQVWGQD